MYLDPACFSCEQLVAHLNISQEYDNFYKTSTSTIEFVSRQHNAVNLFRNVKRHVSAWRCWTSIASIPTNIASSLCCAVPHIRPQTHGWGAGRRRPVVWAKQLGRRHWVAGWVKKKVMLCECQALDPIYCQLAVGPLISDKKQALIRSSFVHFSITLRFSREIPLRYSDVTQCQPAVICNLGWSDSISLWKTCFLESEAKKGIRYFDYFDLSLLLFFSTVIDKSKTIRGKCISAYFWNVVLGKSRQSGNEIANNNIYLFPTVKDN